MAVKSMPGESDYDEKHLDRLSYSYFRKEPWIENEGMGYMSEQYNSKTFTSFSHTISDILNSIIQCQMSVTKLDKFNYDVGLTEVYNGRGYPFSYILLAQK